MENKYENYYKNHNYDINNIDYDNTIKIFNKNFWIIFNKLDKKKTNILEIWCWLWTFTNYIMNEWFYNYTWIDLDNYCININKSKFKKYNFYLENASSFLINKKNQFDIIYISHVFEHFSIEEWLKLSKLINSSLKNKWIWINIMPNAQSLYYSWYMRYVDITHKIIYSPSSFNQVLLKSWFNKENIEHKNMFIWYTVFKRLLYKIWLYFHKLLLASVWSKLYQPHTDNLISIIKK